MSEDNGDIWADDDTEGDSEEEGAFNFFDEPGGDTWEDSTGGFHELNYGEPELEGAEYRAHFDTFEESEVYINRILTGADQFFDIFYDAEENMFEIWYMGGSP